MSTPGAEHAATAERLAEALARLALEWWGAHGEQAERSDSSGRVTADVTDVDVIEPEAQRGARVDRRGSGPK